MKPEEELRIAIQLSESEQYRQAIKILNKLLNKNPRDQRAMFERAYAFSCTGSVSSAIEDLNELLQINPDYPGAKEWFARLANEKGDALSAAEILYAHLKGNPNGEPGLGVSPQKWSDCATYYLNANKNKKGIEILNEYFDNYAENVTQYVSYETAPMRTLSMLYSQNGEYDDAFHWAEKAMNSKYKVPADFEQYIWALFHLNRTSEAKQQYRNYIQTIHGGVDNFLHIQKLKQSLFG